ncbi:heterokaryon incompatibility protein-domain-containing protein [Ilyonectria destructans]|nr:heterokaryon incompatibility protein-domain-containing protein [Ilyonectria destructans]
MGLNDSFVYPALTTDTQTRVIVLAPGEAEDAIHCFNLVIDLDEDWELQETGSQSQTPPQPKGQSYIEVKTNDGQVVQGFTVPALRSDPNKSGHLHPFQRYTALSYVWGDDSSSHQIFLNREPFHVGDNLYTALKRSRNALGVVALLNLDGTTESCTAKIRDKRLDMIDRHLMPEGRVLWVDVLCVNQANIAEREAQVKLMARIYRQADYVHADLGYGGDEGGMKLFHLLKTVTEAGSACESHAPVASSSSSRDQDGDSTQQETVRAIASNWKKLHSKWRRILPSRHAPKSEVQSLEDQGLPSADDPIWDWWRQFLNSPYFRRLWVIQEFSLAKGISLWFGTVGIDPEMVSGSIHYLGKYSTNRGYYVTVESTKTSIKGGSAAGLSAFASLMTQRQTIGNSIGLGAGYSPLLDKLGLAREALATDQRDKMYCMLGLASDGSAFSHLVSYSKDVETVYEDFARLFVERDQAMQMLYQVDSRVSNALKLPTWVPDWSRAANESLLGHKPKDLGKYAASKEEVPIIQLSQVDSTLRVNGALFDTITRLSKPLHHESTKVNQTDLFKFILEGGHFSLDLKNYPTGEEPDYVMLWTLVCDRRESKSAAEANRLRQSLWAIIGQMVTLAARGPSEDSEWLPHLRDIMQHGLPNALGRSWCLTEMGISVWFLEGVR